MLTVIYYLGIYDTILVNDQICDLSQVGNKKYLVHYYICQNYSCLTQVNNGGRYVHSHVRVMHVRHKVHNRQTCLYLILSLPKFIIQISIMVWF